MPAAEALNSERCTLNADSMNDSQQKASPNDFRVIIADVEHLRDVAALLDGYRVFYGQPSDLPASSHFLFERMINHESVIYAAQDIKTEQLVGFLQLYPTFSSVSLKPVWILNDLYVQPEFRKRGIARMLVQQAIELVQERRDKGLILETAPDNLPAQCLYASLGFHQDDSFHHYALWL